jgi:hypothetical protein
MDRKFNREPRTPRQRSVLWLAAAATVAGFCLAASAPLGWYRTSRDAHWCKAFGHPVTQCVEGRRGERWGPFNAWGDNGHGASD